MPIRLFFIVFSKGYHVGWRRPEKIIDHVTLLRALMSVAYSLGDEWLAREIASGCLSATALLPAVPVGKCTRLLTVFPTLPAIVKASKLGVSWITLHAAHRVVTLAQKCANTSTWPVLSSVKDKLLIKCQSGEDKLELDVWRGVACVPGEDCRSLQEGLEAPIELFEELVEYHNRIDRVTGAADLYRLSGWAPRVPLWLAVRGEEKVLRHVEASLEALRELGIGGYRSRGWGSFKLVGDARPCSLDMEVLEGYSAWSTGYNMLLGSMFLERVDWIDGRLSFAKPRIFMGISGQVYDEYRLPVIEAMDIGSLVYARSTPSLVVYKIGTASPHGKAYIVFNPLVVSSA